MNKKVEMYIANVSQGSDIEHSGGRLIVCPKDYPLHRLCGMQFTSIFTDEELTLKQVWYLLSRIRTPHASYKTHHKICMWQEDGCLCLKIGMDTLRITDGDYMEIKQWIDIALQETFE